LQAVKQTNEWVVNNTNLGIIILLIPIAASGAISNNLTELQDNIGLLMENTNSLDAVALYKAIGIAGAGGMGSHDEFDVMSVEAQKDLVVKDQSMYDVLNKKNLFETLVVLTVSFQF
jgi:triphosphoribosyl-dephospho-CoA synthase